MAMGKMDLGLTMCEIRSSASSEPSIRTSLGRTRSSNWRRCHAAAGERWRTPKMCGTEDIKLFADVGFAGGVEAAPGGATFFHYVRKIIFPDDEILIVVFDDGALQAGGEVVVADGAVAEIAGERHAVRQQGNGFGGGEDAGGSFDFVFAIERLAGAQFAEDGHDFCDGVFIRNFGFQLEIVREFAHAFGDDGNFG